jgi:hypothetical protein
MKVYFLIWLFFHFVLSDWLVGCHPWMSAEWQFEMSLGHDTDTNSANQTLCLSIVHMYTPFFSFMQCDTEPKWRRDRW